MEMKWEMAFFFPTSGFGEALGGLGNVMSWRGRMGGWLGWAGLDWGGG